jgi:hypothetical protein
MSTDRMAALQVLILTFLICLIQMTLNCHSFVKKWIQKITINTADIFDIFDLFNTDDSELSQLCEKMNTENNSCKLFGLWGHDEHYELECDQFTERSTKTYKGGLKDLELKNKKITHYCQEGKTFSVLLLHIIKKEHLHIF